MPRLGAESSEINVDNAGLRDWITNEVSQILLEEFSGIIGRITIRLILRFSTFIQNVEEIVEATRGKDLDVGACQEKRKLTRDSTFSVVSEEFDVANIGTGSRGDFEICSKCGGSHRFTCHKFKCYKYGKKGHIVPDCKKGRTCFHYHQPGHLKLGCSVWVAKRVQCPTPIVRQEVKVDLQEITDVNFDLQFYLEWTCKWIVIRIVSILELLF